jgi:hypothetical protein
MAASLRLRPPVVWVPAVDVAADGGGTSGAGARRSVWVAAHSVVAAGSSDVASVSVRDTTDDAYDDAPSGMTTSVDAEAGSREEPSRLPQRSPAQSLGSREEPSVRPPLPPPPPPLPLPGDAGGSPAAGTTPRELTESAGGLLLPLVVVVATGAVCVGPS